MDPSFSLTNIAVALNVFTLLCTIFFFVYRKFRSHQKTETMEENKTREENNTMASSSLVPSSLPRNWNHHVFPSFHGADARRSFLSHILKELKSKAIDLFIDNNIERSKSIGPELIEAIRGSRIAIVLLSENYASSTWCLDELVEIINCRDVLGQTVMPLFYEVDPTDVKKQTGEFGKVFRNTCKGKTNDNIGRWKHALAEVAKIAGYHSGSWDNEAKMIENIATDVSNKLNLSIPSSHFDGFVGMETHMFNMEPFLRLESEVKMVGIWGPSGIGKTTIARFLFNRYSQDFQISVFVENIKRIPIPVCSDDHSVKLYLQGQFMSKIINQKGVEIQHLGIVKDRLKDKKVLVVLDDVDHLVQLQAMAEKTCWFGPSSRIIITTQDQRLLQRGGVKHTYKVDFPSSDEALEMFCMYAFDQKFTKDGFLGLAREVTELVGKLPLGLRIMGSYFRGMSEQEWKTELPRLRTRLDGEIESILKFSYDALCDDDKSLFLHIACFFNYDEVDIVEGCLANSLSVRHVTQGLGVLAHKSLISLDNGFINMHGLLLRLGREIMRKQYVNKPWKRQFLEDTRDIDQILSNDNRDSSSVIGIHLYFPDDKDQKEIYERVFERFSNLQFLRVEGSDPSVYLSQSQNSLPPNLRYLSWNHFNMTCFPPSFQTKFLVTLDMEWSSLEKLWEGIKPLDNLKVMDLSDSKKLKEVPDLSTATNLRELDLIHCSSLMELPSSIGYAINLQKLYLAYCSSLVELPSSMKDLRRLSKLELGQCSALEVVLTNINLESLEELNLTNCSSLKCHLETCTNTEEDLNLSNNSISHITRSCEIQELGPWIGRVSRLRKLNIRGMKNLVSLPQLPYSITKLDADYCGSLERLDCSFRNPSIHLNFGNSFKLNQEARDIIIHTRTNDFAVLPGEEVPGCFTYRASGSSLTVELNQNPLHTSTKFKSCIIFTNKDKNLYGVSLEVNCSITSNQNAGVSVCKRKLEPAYIKHLHIFEVEAEEVTSTELLFEFELNNQDWEIKECGIMQLMDLPSSDGHYKCFKDGDEDSDMERQILRPKLDKQASGE